MQIIKKIEQFQPTRPKKSFLFRSQVFIIKAIKVSAKVTNRILAVSVIGQIRLVHVKFLAADKAGFNLFFHHIKTLKKKKIIRLNEFNLYYIFARVKSLQ